MQGGTRKIERSQTNDRGFRQHSRASLVIVAGGAEGMEFSLDADRVTIGRDPGADITLEDSAISKLHAALELTADGFRVRDLDSTNGTRVNGEVLPCADLKHGDRIDLGDHGLQYVVEPVERAPRAFNVD